MVHVVADAICPQNNRYKLADKRWKVIHDTMQAGLIGYRFVSEYGRAADVAFVHSSLPSTKPAKVKPDAAMIAILPDRVRV